MWDFDFSPPHTQEGACPVDVFNVIRKGST